jgi:hypothetical protein
MRALLLAAWLGGTPLAYAQTCVQAQVGGEQAYSCLNDSFAHLAQGAKASAGLGVLSAGSPAPAVGTFDHTATAERMGNAFGRSVVPQRPPAPSFGMPLIPGGR